MQIDKPLQPPWSDALRLDAAATWVSPTDWRRDVEIALGRFPKTFDDLAVIVASKEWDLLIRSEQPTDEELRFFGRLAVLGSEVTVGNWSEEADWAVKIPSNTFSQHYLQFSICKSLTLPSNGSWMLGNWYSDLFCFLAPRETVREFINLSALP